jgi:uncharacterized protein
VSVSAARVPTGSASRYLQQLCKHWAHRMETGFTPEEGWVAFPNGSRLEMRADVQTLDCVLSVPDGEDAGRMRTVVQEHLDRFAFREAPLTFEWRDGAQPPITSS